ncbi:MAG: molybdopterin oxidoreductase family protein [Promethearchaeota archaeon]
MAQKWAALKELVVELTRRFGACARDCTGGCAFVAFWDDGAPTHNLVRVEASSDHPYTRGKFCKKYARRVDLLYHPDRLVKPLVRSGPKGTNRFRGATTSEAFSLVAREAAATLDEDPLGLLVATYAGNSGLLSQHFAGRLVRALGASVTTGSICNSGGMAGLKALLGTYSPTNPFQLLSPECRLVVVWGCNITETDYHAYMLVKRALEGGAKLVVVDPVPTRVAKRAHLHVQPRPGGDLALVALVCHELGELGALDEKFCEERVPGWRKPWESARSKSASQLEELAGVDASIVDAFAGVLAEHAGHAIVRAGFGLQKHRHGGRVVQALAWLQLFLGNFGRPGAGLIYSQSDHARDKWAKARALASGEALGEPGRRVDLLDLASTLTRGDGSRPPVRLLFVQNFNPASSLPDQARLRRGLSRDDLFVVVLSDFLNETTRFADVVFPVKFAEETPDLVTSWGVPGVVLNEGGPCPHEACRSNPEFWRALAEELGLGDLPEFRGTERELLDRCLEVLPGEVRADLLERGYHVATGTAEVWYSSGRFPFPFQPGAPPDPFEFLDRLATVAAGRPGEFALLTPCPPDHLHSQLDQVARDKAREPFGKLFVSPADAEALEARPGEVVVVETVGGQASGEFRLATWEGLRRGVAVAYSGGPDLSGGRYNANFFTPAEPEELGGSGTYNGGRVVVRPLRQKGG